MSRAWEVTVRLYRGDPEENFASDTWKVQAGNMGLAAKTGFWLSADELRGRGKTLPRNMTRAIITVKPNRDGWGELGGPDA